MPKHIEQPEDLGDFPRLNDNYQAAAKLRVGTSKWFAIRDQIERVRIGGREYWSDEALLRFANKNTLKPGTPRPPSRMGRKPRKAVTLARLAAKRHKPGVTVGQRPVGAP